MIFAYNLDVLLDMLLPDSKTRYLPVIVYRFLNFATGISVIKGNYGVSQNR
jgi:hypothetical protein